MRRGLLGAPAALLLLLTVVLHPVPAVADDSADVPAPGHPWFGPALDIHTDTPTSYADRLGTSPSLYTFPVDLPLSGEGVDQLHVFAADVATQGAVLVLQVEPTIGLDDLRPADDTAVADLVADLASDFGLQVLVRFAPEMNGSWRPWGQQPESYVAAFRSLADVVHHTAPSAAMVWSPVYGSGYPFRKSSGTDSEIDLSPSRQGARLDTDGDGRLGPGDDPYGPYYPGDAAVDWVGLFLYRFGQSQGLRRNVVPPRDEVGLRLAERWGYAGGGGRSFYSRFSGPGGHPLLLETAALHNPAVGGASALGIERRWWREVFAALPAHPMIGAISWLELSRQEPEVSDESVDWGVTATPEIAGALRADLAASPVALGPVTTPWSADRPPAAATTEQALRAAVAGPEATALAARVAAGLLVVVLLLIWLGTRRPAWAYEDAETRDGRIDLVRGGLLVATIALHLPVAGVLHDVASGALAIGGLETFVLLSGLCVGVVYPPVARRLGHAAAAGRRLRRALVIWLAAVGAVLGAGLLSLVPGLDRADIGAVGPPDARLDLYAGARHLLDYPPPGWIARDLLSLHLGTWLVLPLALLAALQLVAFLAAGPLVRGWWWAVLPVSWLLYVGGRWSDTDVLPSYSEVVAPVLLWQVLFVHGIAAGRYRDPLTSTLRRPAGTAALAVATVVCAFLLWSGAAPSGSSPSLPLPRALVVTTTALLALALVTTCWRPVVRGCGLVLLPLGEHPLLVVLAQPVLVLVVAATPAVDTPWSGTLVTVASVAVLVVLLRALTRRRSRPRQPSGQDVTV